MVHRSAKEKWKAHVYTSELSNPPKPKRIRTDTGRKTKRSELPSPRDHKQIKTDTGSRKRKAASPIATGDKQLPSKKNLLRSCKDTYFKNSKENSCKTNQVPHSFFFFFFFFFYETFMLNAKDTHIATANVTAYPK